MHNIYKLLVISILLLSTSLNAQTTVIEGEIRPRTEFQDGFGKPIYRTNDPGIFTTQRTRLGINFSSGLLTTQITLQDVRTFGQYQTNASTASTGLFEAWAHMLLFPGASLTIGQQAIKYDDNRLFSAASWSTTGNAHDMALLKYSINDFQLHLGYAYNNNTEIATETYYSPGNKYRSMGLLWLSTPTYKNVTLTGIWVDEGLQDTVGTKKGANYKKTNFRHAYTAGGNLKYEPHDLPISGLLTGYFQTGHDQLGRKYNGKLIAAKLNYTATRTIGSNLGIDYYSGDKDGTKDGTISSFKKLYGVNHSFNGYMEYWKTNPTVGLIDYYCSLNGKLTSDLTLESTFHLFNTEYQSSSYGKDLGSELDFTATYKLNTWTTIQAGYSTYFENTNTRQALNLSSSALRSPQWAYLMCTIKPTFLGK